DRELLRTLGRRFEVAKNIAVEKQKARMRIIDCSREKAILQERIKLFSESGFDDAVFVRELFSIIIKKSRQIQRICMKEQLEGL
ncbi:chorismate mutase, partial [Candidatus Woesearchaeota archaeon]|nr:chorismate mutase [Candidatus Woesearchaeota archaeon]